MNNTMMGLQPVDQVAPQALLTIDRKGEPPPTPRQWDICFHQNQKIHLELMRLEGLFAVVGHIADALHVYGDHAVDLVRLSIDNLTRAEGNQVVVDSTL